MDLRKLREINIRETKQKVKDSVTDDLILIQGVHAYNELIRVESRLLNVLKEWYGYYFPELTEKDNFPELIPESKNVLMKKFGIKETMGSDLSDNDVKTIKDFSKQISELKKSRISIEDYISIKMKKIAPELYKTATSIVGARLIERAGSLKHLAELPSSTIQILGAEKSLFRHLRQKTKPPKYGVIFFHPDLVKAKQDEKGKAARKLAARISIAVKQDYFRNERH
ncbi:MAG TPA: hypothetical protein VJJ23_01610 [Candidatus Nanoarchaeia archaeon]|nr:hypothetical protein [Candidatus Nanoarchaeia archaeon]